MALAQRIGERDEASETREGTAGAAVASALRTIGTEREGLACLMEAVADGLAPPFAAAVERIGRARGRCILTGMGKSGHIGRKIAATLASTGTPALYVHPAEASHGDLGMVQPDDVVVALSWSGETTELADIIGYAKRYRVGLVAITSNPASTLGREADVCLTLPKAREACPNGLAPTTSTAMQLALGDALAVALLEARGFSAREFSIYHPGGRLGASLRQVREVMHSGAQLPLVPRGTPMRAAIAEIDAKGFGSVIVVEADGRLAGIVTDGDLRRNVLRTDLDRVSVEAVMSASPRTVSPETLLAKALEIQESMKITALIVVEAGRPVGLVHYHDLLRSGVA
ncbi:KpsF/GutQ family sugar-phosphate isomerase [Methylobacterium oxalidis]|uniref:KpsF/GutQ family protein n=1 Tax=Methylobacterium oxalidis TaxID=944322 RepID=A0A512J8B7_9HYPH|nr:KpsF/GutQ family sugar-phosphate isomerase [Methylobacterium oxalidis]GEP06206.1 KpsF/GutQ family protein [Methylobacterium oxalidis]GJE33820.1 Arabinose 5-phosphate isomerase KdsD [Methylobacterium oxalidis]GLS62986.1 KpsF/GutQ family protein [Methylobacterium oxalidis]